MIRTGSPSQIYGIGGSAGSITLGASDFLAWDGRAKLKSPADGIITLLNNAESGFTRLQFGGTSSSFPALVRTGTDIQLKGADDSVYGDLISLRFRDQNSAGSLDQGYISLGNARSILFSSTILYSGTKDTRIVRKAAGVVAVDATTDGSQAALELSEAGTSDIAAGAAGSARLYARDNGAGKTQLCVRFATGAVQVLSTEP